MANQRREIGQWDEDRSEDAPVQQAMRQAAKPIQRRQPSQDQKRVRRQMQREGASVYRLTSCPDHPDMVVGDRATQSAYLGRMKPCCDKMKHAEPGEQVKEQSGFYKSKATLQKGAPFAGYKDFDACVAANADKDNPEAYCGFIKHKVEGMSHSAAEPGDEQAGDRECQACGRVGPPAMGDTSPVCSGCGSYSLARATARHPALASKTATLVETNVASADGRILLNSGDKINTPTGQTLTVNQVRRHETSRDHYYVDTDAGTTVVPYSTKFTLVPGENTQQQPFPSQGTPGANFPQMPGHPGTGGSSQAPDACPSCGTKGALVRQGDKYRCNKCGYADTFMGQGEGMDFSDSPLRLTPPRRTSRLNDPRGLIARRAAMVAGEEEENPL